MLKRIKKEYLRFIRRQFYRYEDEITGSKVLENVYKRKSNKRVLISYLQRPFLVPFDNSHTNWLECKIAADIFDELGFIVDVVNFTTSGRSINYKKYEIIYGGGSPVTQALNKSVKTILYSPGCSSVYQRRATLNALHRFLFKSGYCAWDSIRLCEDVLEQYGLSDLIITLGNSFVADTYKLYDFKQKIVNIPLFFLDGHEIDLSLKNYRKARNKFLWFGSAGAVHKGLDVLFNVFKERDDIELYVCGLRKEEYSFHLYYKDEVSNNIPNIKNLGFVKLESPQFKQILNDCVSVICPSVSEGGAASVLNIMGNGGLIPIVSKATGLEMEDNCYILENISEGHVSKAIDEVLKISEKELFQMSQQIMNYTKSYHSIENYRTTLKKHILSQTVENSLDE